MEWLIAAGLHPRANATTLRVAEDLAARMDYDLGHVRYGLDDMAARLGISRASVKRHVRYLRELGALAWVQHGTRANIRRVLGLDGYAATATVYAAVIPSVYDRAMGHTVIGSGYAARVRVHGPGHTSAPAHAPAPVDKPPVDNSSPLGLEPPSLRLVREDVQVQVVGGVKDTSQARPSKSRVPHQRSEMNGRRRTAADVQKAGKTVRLVRALVNWTQPVGLRRLEFVLRPWTDRGLDAYQIAGELHGMCSGMRWKPARADAFILARLAADQQREKQLQDAQAAVERWERENGPVGAFRSTCGQYEDFMAGHHAGLAAYSAAAKARGWDDLSTPNQAPVPQVDFETGLAAFLGTRPESAAAH